MLTLTIAGLERTGSGKHGDAVLRERIFKNPYLHGMSAAVQLQHGFESMDTSRQNHQRAVRAGRTATTIRLLKGHDIRNMGGSLQ